MNRIRRSLLATAGAAILAVVGTPNTLAESDPTFTTIDFPGAVLTQALGINPRGDIVGPYQSGDLKLHGYLLSGGNFTTIDVPFPGAPAMWAIRRWRI